MAMDSIQFGDATIRQPKIRVEIDRWDWPKWTNYPQTPGVYTDMKFRDTIDITNAVMAYQWQKTIKSPMGGAQLTLTPMFRDAKKGKEMYHFFDVIGVMDVVKIYEFDVLKFQGYIRRMGTKGVIMPDGKPFRTVSLNVTHIGGMFSEPTTSLIIAAYRMKDKDSKFENIFSAASSMVTKIANKTKEGMSFSQLAYLVIDEWFSFMSSLGMNFLKDYIDKYIDYSTVLQTYGAGVGSTVLPKDPAFFYNSSTNISLWTEIMKLCEAPFNEFWFDEGPRDISIGEDTWPIYHEKTYLIGRPTPFDNSMRNGSAKNYFSKLNSLKIPLKYVTQWDFNRTMEESYSVYAAMPWSNTLNELTLYSYGAIVVDDRMLSKYLCRPLHINLFYTEYTDPDSTKENSGIRTIMDESKQVAQTLMNWFSNNDEFLSGAITMNVPPDDSDDPRIGMKVSLEGIDGEFYVEGVTHSWQYQGPMISNLSVTRGYSNSGKIELKDAIFRGANIYES